jgi:hypothetical protein
MPPSSLADRMRTGRLAWANMRPNSSALWALPVAKKISMRVVRIEEGEGSRIESR